MLKFRVLTSIIGLPILAAGFLLGGIPFASVIFAVCIIALYEFYRTFEKAGFTPLKMIGYLCCIPVLAVGILKINTLNTITPLVLNLMILFFILLIIISFLIILFRKDRYSFDSLAITFAAVLYIPFMFLFTLFVRNMPNGAYFIWFIFIGAWATDTFAYFIGRKFGKHKLIPEVSPNKTVEGSVAGLAAAILFTVVFGCLFFHTGMIYIVHYSVIGVISGIFSQLGDLTASSIKRFTRVKDYGNILPGHGGIMDRFDSILFIAPLIYFYLCVFF